MEGALWPRENASCLAVIPGTGERKIKLVGRGGKRNIIKPNIPRLKSLSLPSHSPALYVRLSLPLPGGSCNKCLSSEPRNFSNLPGAGRALFIWIWEEGVCVLQFLPCQPSILERMKQPWRIWAAAADLSRQPEDPGCRGATAFRQLPPAPAAPSHCPAPSPPAQNSPRAQSQLLSPQCHPLKIPPRWGWAKLLPSL